MADDDDAADRRPKRGRNPSFGALRRLRPRPAERNLPSVGTEVARASTEIRLPHLNADEQRKLPHGMAELIVYRLDSAVDGERGFGLRAASCCSEPCDIRDSRRSYGKPNLDLGTQIARGGTPPAKFLRRMHTWSSEQGSLTRWLDKCRHEHDTLELVVWDDTGFRIPWELLWLPAASGDGEPAAGYLGAVVTVTRWFTMYPHFRHRVSAFSNHAPYRASGAVAAYFAEGMTDDARLFDNLVVEHAEDMEDLFTKLSTATLPGALAMVYVACHGQFADNPEDCALDGFPLGRATQISDDLIRLRKQAALVFLNGCHSGSAGIDMSTYNDGALRSFAGVFLRSGAAGVLATTGAVGKDEARVLAGDLLRHLREHPELSVAEAVRQLRVSAAAEMVGELLRTNLPEDEQEQADRTLHRLLYPFMYVYYGSPRMLLSLEERGGLADVAELAVTGV